MNLCLGSQVWPGRAVLVPISGPEQPHSSPEDTRGVNQSLRALRQLGGLVRRPAAQFSPRDKPKFTGHWHCLGGILRRRASRSHAERRHCWGGQHGGFERTARGGMTKKPLVSVVDDDQFFREFDAKAHEIIGLYRRGFCVGGRFPRIPSSRRNGLPDRRRQYACDDRNRTLPTPHRCRARDSDNPRDCLPQ